jgi:hypothetical protein
LLANKSSSGIFLLAKQRIGQAEVFHTSACTLRFFSHLDTFLHLLN